MTHGRSSRSGQGGAVAPEPTNNEIVIPGSATTLYWMLPGPNAFMEYVAGLLNQRRAVAIHLNERTVLGHQTLLDQALARAHFDSLPVTLLRVYAASQIECDIAQHLCANNERQQISPAILADWHTRHLGGHVVDRAQESSHTFVLRPHGEEAMQVAWRYMQDFASALPGSLGNTRLILERSDKHESWPESELAPLRSSGHFASAQFDGALGPDEMTAYLGMRMAISGFSTQTEDLFVFPTKRLFKALIAEFASFDAHFAEGLMQMSAEELMALPQSLGALASRLPVSDTVWRHTSTKLGTLLIVEGKTLVHTLHEWHLASHSGRYQATAIRELERKKWRAYLTSLMPWFEQLRHALIDNLKDLLSVHLAPTNGMRVRRNPETGQEWSIAIGDLECNDIASLTRGTAPIRARTFKESASLDLCARIGRVRNEIAHMRAPQVQDIQRMLASLDTCRRAMP